MHAAPYSLPRPRLRRRGLLFELVESLLLMAMIYALVDMASVRFYVDGPSMEPSFYSDQRVIVSRVSYYLRQPARGEVVVFQSPDRPGIDPPLIKRVIGLPGETVALRDGHVEINGRPLDEDFINEPCSDSRCRDREWQLGADEFFVMGDNRNHSRDSRVFGPVSRANLIGEAVFRYWPPNDWSLLASYRFPADPFG